MLGKAAKIFAFALGELTHEDIPGLSNFVSLGFDCLGKNGMDSYLYSEAGWLSYKEEISELGIHFNENGLLKTEEDAKKYAIMRRNAMEIKPGGEELGIECVVSIGIVQFD